MAGQVPMTRPPAYGRELGQTLMAGSAARGEAVGAELDARAAALGHILGNIKGIAEVGGGDIAPDKLISQFAGGDVPIFGGDYAGMADRLRLAQMAADVAATGRSGRGGSSGPAPKPGQWYEVDYGDGQGVQQIFVPYNEADSLPYHLQVQINEGSARPIPAPADTLTNNPYVRTAPGAAPTPGLSPEAEEFLRGG